ncbi:MAG: hypothetical protein AAF770_01230 [Bacteroidota bacterium]
MFLKNILMYTLGFPKGNIILLIVLLFFPIKAKKEFRHVIHGLSKPYDYADEAAYHSYLWRCYQFPIDLNYVTAEELKKLGILSDKQINALITYIQAYGNLYSIDELAAIPGWDFFIISKITPFVTVKDVRKKKRKKRKKAVLIQKLSLDWDPQWQDRKSDDLGSPHAVTLDYKIQYLKKLTLSVSNYKGVGESWDKSYTTANCTISKMGIVNKILLGKITIRIGQGLLIGGSSFDENAFFTIKNRQYSLIPSKSTQRNSALLGCALLLQKSESPFSLILYGGLTPYYVNKRQENGQSFFTTIHKNKKMTSYRSQKSWQGNKGIVEPLIGAALLYKPDRTTCFGAQVMGHNYLDHQGRWRPISRQIDAGKYLNRHGYVGIFGSQKWQYSMLSGELVATLKEGVGLIVAGTVRPNSYLKHAIKIRYNTPCFYALHSADKKSRKPYQHKSIGIVTNYLGSNKSILNGMQLYETKNWVNKQIVKGCVYKVTYAQMMPRYNLRLVLRGQAKYNTVNGLLSRLNVKIPAYYLSEGCSGSTIFYWSAANKKKYLNSYYLGSGISQIVQYQKAGYTVKLGCALFKAPKQVGLYLYQPNIRFPYVKRYSGQGIATTIWGRYQYSAQSYIILVGQWRLVKKQNDSWHHYPFLAIRFVYTIRE